MYDSTFYSKKYKCPLMSLFYLEIIDPTLLKNGCYIACWLICNLIKPPQLYKACIYTKTRKVGIRSYQRYFSDNLINNCSFKWKLN